MERPQAVFTDIHGLDQISTECDEAIASPNLTQQERRAYAKLKMSAQNLRNFLNARRARSDYAKAVNTKPQRCTDDDAPNPPDDNVGNVNFN